MRQTILDRLRTELLNRASFDTLPKSIWKRVGALNTYGTNAIEGNTLTQAEVDAVLLESKGVRKQIQDVLETVQHDIAFRGLVARRGRAIDLVTVQELHEQVFRPLMADAGQWRRVNVVIQGAKFTPPSPDKIVPRMIDLFSQYDSRDLAGEDVFTLGSWLHHGFECIHPFSNGNGRVGRLVLNLHFLRHNWPPINVLPADRDRYLAALRVANDGDTERLSELLRILMGSSLLYFLSKVGTAEDELSPLSALPNDAGYSPKYLALRAKQGELPSIMIKGEWNLSQRAYRFYVDEVGRSRNG